MPKTLKFWGNVFIKSIILDSLIIRNYINERSLQAEIQGQDINYLTNDQEINYYVISGK